MTGHQTEMSSAWRWLWVCAVLVFTTACAALERVGEARSPDGKTIAAVYWLNAGAMSSGTTVVSLRPADEPFSRTVGRIFQVRAMLDVKVRWSGTALEVECRRCEAGRIEQKEARWGVVEIRYPNLGADVGKPWD
jgi:hypothetical protein